MTNTCTITCTTIDGKLCPVRYLCNHWSLKCWIFSKEATTTIKKVIFSFKIWSQIWESWIYLVYIFKILYLLEFNVRQLTLVCISPFSLSLSLFVLSIMTFNVHWENSEELLFIIILCTSINNLRVTVTGFAINIFGVAVIDFAAFVIHENSKHEKIT